MGIIQRLFSTEYDEYDDYYEDDYDSSYEGNAVRKKRPRFLQGLSS